MKAKQEKSQELPHEDFESFNQDILSQIHSESQDVIVPFLENTAENEGGFELF